ncbi:MAG: hypothetical protein KTR27_13185 [Leptolyngbyaceae cyanobacterium MAG.088]|nr:hypothetical protein [Leptolyngbyaceae cyanobacterium MAG.088]
MKTHVGLASSERSVIVNNSEYDSMAPYVGLSVLIYVLLLFVLAPRARPAQRRKSLL